MPDITAARPVSGTPIETGWGDQVHDAIEGIQSGFVDVTLTASATGTAAVTFARAYATAPAVVLVGNSVSAALVAKLSSSTPPSTTGFTAVVQHAAGTSTSATVRVYWIAVGTPA